MPISAGETISAAEYGEHPRIIARGRRTSNTGAVSAVTGVLRLDDIPLAAGRSYRIMTNGVPIDGTVTTDMFRMEIRYTADGSTPTAASTTLPGAWARGNIGNTTDGPIANITADYAPAGAETLSLILCIARSQGTGTMQVLADPSFPVDMWVEDMGEDPGDTGTDI
jgi:hypothetical protein